MKFLLHILISVLNMHMCIHVWVSCLWTSIFIKIEMCIFWIGLTNCGNGLYLSMLSGVFVGIMICFVVGAPYGKELSEPVTGINMKHVLKENVHHLLNVCFCDWSNGLALWHSWSWNLGFGCTKELRISTRWEAISCLLMQCTHLVLYCNDHQANEN